MNIISGGHQLGGGAYGIISETDENRKVVSEILKIDSSIKDVSVNYSTSANNELAEKVQRINNLSKTNNVNCYSDIHFNAFNGTAKGVECIVLGFESGLYASKESYEENYRKAKNVCDSIAVATGLFNRGVKTNNKFYVLRKPNCHSMIVEVCFLDNQEDMDKYNATTIAKAIVQGLNGNVIDKPITPPITPPTPKPPTSEEYQIDRYLEDGKATICVEEGVYFYNNPYISTITGSYENNESVYYDTVVITNKYVYVSWISASTGIRRYMPVKDKVNNERWGNCI